MADAKQNRSVLSAIPKSVWALGMVSLLMDTSSEAIHALLPVYLVTVMGTSMVTVGIIEGIAEATAHITKIFSGAISDWLGRRKLLAVLGYGLSALTKPVFPLAPNVGWLVGARFVDRIGKGIRGAPRDALVADITPEDMRGAAYGLRQSLDTVGAFLGPLMAIALMWLTADNFRATFWVAVIPAVICVGVLLAFVHEPDRGTGTKRLRAPLSLQEIRTLGPRFWQVTAVAVVFALARFSEAFLILRAETAGLMIALVPLVLVVMNIAYALAAYPAGALSDRTNRMTVLMIGLVLLVLADLLLAYGTGIALIGLGIVLWGLHMGFTQGLFSALVADTAPAELRGTAFGAYNLMSGLMTLAASVLAGGLWDLTGYQGTFLAGGGFALLALAGVLILRPRFDGAGASDT